MTRLRLALFDMDGTLVDSQAHIVLAMQRAFEGEGMTPPTRQAILSKVGLALELSIPELAGGVAAPVAARMVESYKAAYTSLRGADAAASSPLYPGARACLDALEQDPAILLGVATGKSRKGLRHVFEMHDLDARFLTVQVGDDHPSKPNPSMVFQALRDTGVEPQDCIVIGDTSYDMEMGRAAGVRTLGVSWGYHDESAVVAAGAERIARSFDAVPGLLRELWEMSDG